MSEGIYMESRVRELQVKLATLEQACADKFCWFQDVVTGLRMALDSAEKRIAFLESGK